jgi:amidohydrolase
MSDVRFRILASIDALRDEIVEAALFLHRRPELSFQEQQAARFLSGRLASRGFAVERGAAGLPTAFAARCGSGKPIVGFIAEYDALPGIGHGCGHDLIGASGYGAGIALAPFIDEIGGTICVFGTPAEEAGGGKIPMIEKGVFDGVDAAFCMHPEGVYLVNTQALALDAMEFVFLGRESHAAAAPHEGLNALDALILHFNAISALRQQLKPDVRIHGIITEGGKAPNIIPARTSAQFYVRSESRAYLDEVTEKVRNCARGAARAAGCRVRIRTFEPSLDDMINNPVLKRLMEHNLRSLGVERIEEKEEEPGSTDMGNLSHAVPSLYFYVATTPKGIHLHTRQFTRSSTAPQAMDSLILSVKAMALTAVDILCDPGIAEEIRRAHG